MTDSFTPHGIVPETDQDAMLDVAANTLAVIIMVTVFALAAMNERLPVPPAPDAVPDPNLPVTPGERASLLPVSRFFVFVEHRQFSLDGAEIYSLLSDTPGPVLNRETDQGVITFLPDPTGNRDADQYSFRFHPDAEYVADLPHIDSETARSLVADLEKLWSETGVAPTFIVYPSGMDAFAMLHERLRDGMLAPWRWHPLEEGEALRVSRNANTYRNPTIYW